MKSKNLSGLLQLKFDLFYFYFSGYSIPIQFRYNSDPINLVLKQYVMVVLLKIKLLRVYLFLFSKNTFEIFLFFCFELIFL